jgi:alkylation response protein AidB-like acyl-CoA dehydrogenase
VTTRSNDEPADAAARAALVNGDARSALALALDLTESAPLPGGGRTHELFELLAAVAAEDLTAARIVEAHLDARAILIEAGHPAPVGGWGVFAAEGPGVRLEARESHGVFSLNGTKPWCSVAGILQGALVTAHTGGSTRRLFQVRLDDPGVHVHEEGWAAVGLAAVPSTPVDFDGVVATPVGEDGWYLERPGFAWGGIGVAACWLGGAVGVARRLWSGATSTVRGSTGREPDQIALMHLGAVDAALFAGKAALAHAADRIDSGRAVGADGALLAARVRAVVAGVVDDVVRRAGHSLGPAPLAQEREHARRVADLELYVRQHHAERDEASLGRRLLRGEAPW